MKPLFVYGTLCPGRSNAHILEAIGGEWRPGYVTGTFYARGWGAAADFPGIVLDAHGPRVNGYLFLSDRLAAHWPMLDDFEEGYDRVPVEVTTDDGQQISAWIYQLQPRGNPRRAARHGTAAQRDRESGVVSANAGILARCFLSFRHADDKTHLTRADAQSRPGQQQKMAKVQRTAKKSRVQAREAREAVEENKKAQLERDKQLSEQQKQAVLAKEYKAQVKQLIEMNRITVARGDIGFNFTDNNLIKKIMVDKPTQTQLINGRLAIARLAVDNKPEGEYAIIPAVVAEKIAQRDASSIVLHSALSQDEQDEDDPYADFKVPDDLMW